MRQWQTERQAAVLAQVYRGLGGSVQALTRDLLDLATAQGRASSEAMEAGTHWARLGLSRRGIVAGTTASLMAANLGGISAGEATELLSSLSSAYKLRPSELGPTLGGLARITQTQRIEMGDLLKALSRTSNVGRTAGLSVMEQGMLRRGH